MTLSFGIIISLVFLIEPLLDGRHLDEGERHDIADMVATFGQEVGAILQKLEALKE